MSTATVRKSVPEALTEAKLKAGLKQQADDLVAQAGEFLAVCEANGGMSKDDAEHFDALHEQADSLRNEYKEWAQGQVDALKRNPAGYVAPSESKPKGSLRLKTGDGGYVNAFTVDEFVNEAKGAPAVGELGDAIHGMLTGNFQNNAQVGSTDTRGGYLLNPEYSSRFIDLARSASVCMRAGAMTVPMRSSELVIAGQASDPTAHWRAETVPVTSTDMTFNRLTLRAKTLAAVIPVSIEFLEDASNAGQIIENALIAAMGLQLDQAALIGSGEGAEPTGLSETTGINSVASVGTPANYDDVSSAVGKVLRANFNGDPSSLAWITHPRDGETYDQLKATDNQPLQKPDWVQNLRMLSTTSLPTTLGAGSDESISFVGDFSQLIFGMRLSGVEIRVLDAGTVNDGTRDWNANTQIMRHIVARMRADVGVLRPTWFTKLEGLTE